MVVVHNIYFDIINVCNLNCKFCMYKDKQKEKIFLDINKGFAKENIKKIIKDKNTKITISGEGEPFLNEKVINFFKKIKTNKELTFITNGFWININSLLKFQQSTKNKIKLRLSLDRYHIKQLNKKIYDSSILFQHYFSNNLNIIFRSILSDREYTINFLKSILTKHKIKYKISNISPLEQKIDLNKKSETRIIYRSIVNPNKNKIKKYVTIEKYLSLWEKTVNKPFTLGNLFSNPTGLSLTIKPGGDIFFYGIEINKLGNIYKNKISIKKLQNNLKGTIYEDLMTIPFKKILKELARDSFIKSKIREINNPYWIIKEIYIIKPKILTEIINKLKSKS